MIEIEEKYNDYIIFGVIYAFITNPRHINR